MKMIEDLLREENCRIVESAEDWKDAVRISLKPLVEEGDCTEEYVNAVFAATEQYGPYYVLTDNMALIHATNKAGVNRTQMAVTVLRKPVTFSEDGPGVRILIALAACDAESHLAGMAAVTELFGDNDRSEDLIRAEDDRTIYNLFVKYAGGTAHS